MGVVFSTPTLSKTPITVIRKKLQRIEALELLLHGDMKFCHLVFYPNACRSSLEGRDR